MGKYLMVHRHNYGVSVAAFIAKDFDPTGATLPALTEEGQMIKLAKLCGLDYEPEKEESIDLVALGDEEVVEVSLKDLQ